MTAQQSDSRRDGDGGHAIGLRLLYMVVFALVYGVAELVAWAVIVFQFLHRLLTGEVNSVLLRFGAQLASYLYQIWRFQTFNTETLPWPFDVWPRGEKPG